MVIIIPGINLGRARKGGFICLFSSNKVNTIYDSYSRKTTNSMASCKRELVVKTGQASCLTINWNY
jgi:hypothetical protein